MPFCYFQHCVPYPRLIKLSFLKKKKKIYWGPKQSFCTDSRTIWNSKKRIAHRNWNCGVDSCQCCPGKALWQTMRSPRGFKRLICGIRVEIWKMIEWRIIKEISCFLWIMALNVSGIFQPIVLRWWLSWDGRAYAWYYPYEISSRRRRERKNAHVCVCVRVCVCFK